LRCAPQPRANGRAPRYHLMWNLARAPKFDSAPPGVAEVKRPAWPYSRGARAAPTDKPTPSASTAAGPRFPMGTVKPAGLSTSPNR
jgi:hypothetical protein